MLSAFRMGLASVVAAIYECEFVVVEYYLTRGKKAASCDYGTERRAMFDTEFRSHHSTRPADVAGSAFYRRNPRFLPANSTDFRLLHTGCAAALDGRIDDGYCRDAQ